MTRDEAIDLSRELRVYRRRLKYIARQVESAWPAQSLLSAAKHEDLYTARHIGEVVTAINIAKEALHEAYFFLEIWHDINDEAELPEESEEVSIDADK